MTTDELALAALLLVERTEQKALAAMRRELEQERQPVSYHGKVIDTHARAEALRRK